MAFPQSSTCIYFKENSSEARGTYNVRLKGSLKAKLKTLTGTEAAEQATGLSNSVPNNKLNLVLSYSLDQ